jgi:DNA (cytosine-5)-methyltransferase 1
VVNEALANYNLTAKELIQNNINAATGELNFIAVLEPPMFSLENVQAYIKSFSLQIILEALYSNGYWVNYQILNAADMGVPQSRRRLILVAVKGGFIPTLPPKQKHIGWYEAIADLIPKCDRYEFALWQKDKTKGITKPFVMSSTEQRADTIRFAHKPIFTIKASDRDPRALIESGETIQLNLECLARLQSFPKDYIWGDKREIIRKAIGNSVPPLMYQAIAGLLTS